MSVKRLGVLGWPVGHSRSPQIFKAAFEGSDLDGWNYQLLPAPPAEFERLVRGLHGAGFVGANVTIPHKQAALAVADSCSFRAEQIGAANLLSFSADGAIVADNSDAPGLLAALGEHARAGDSALVLGAGGSARAVVWALREVGMKVQLWNRTAARAAALAAEFGVEAVSAAVPAQLLVNCTAAGLDGPGASFDELPLTADEVGSYATVVDLVYGDQPSALIESAAAAGSRTIDGREILVQQGAIAFEHWTGVAAPLELMRAAASCP